ncbi:hypothetical protein ACSUZJ_01715 [Telluria sp. B2]
METQTTNQPTCDKEQTKRPWSQKIKTGCVWVVKAALRHLLMRPATWRWLQVHLPEAFAKLEFWVKEFIEFCANLF